MESICTGANPKVTSTPSSGRDLQQFLTKHEVKLQPLESRGHGSGDNDGGGGDAAAPPPKPSSIASPSSSKCMADMLGVWLRFWITKTHRPARR